MPYGTTRKAAEAFAARRNAAALDTANPTCTDHGERPTTRYIVDGYPGTKLYGVTRRWRYADRPDLGEFGGGFELLDAEAASAIPSA